MKLFLVVFVLVFLSSAAHACDTGTTSFIYNGESVVLDSTGRMVVQPTSLIGSKFIERAGFYYVITPRGQEIKLEAHCVG